MKDQLTAEWKRYDKEVKDFEKQMKAKEFHFSIICQMLKRDINECATEWKRDPFEMAKNFEKKIQREIDMARSCDKPNAPGYYRANNE